MEKSKNPYNSAFVLQQSRAVYRPVLIDGELIETSIQAAKILGMHVSVFRKEMKKTKGEEIILKGRRVQYGKKFTRRPPKRDGTSSPKTKRILLNPTENNYGPIGID